MTNPIAKLWHRLVDPNEQTVELKRQAHAAIRSATPAKRAACVRMMESGVFPSSCVDWKEQMEECARASAEAGREHHLPIAIDGEPAPDPASHELEGE